MNGENVDNIIVREALLADAKSLENCIDAAYAPFIERIPDLPAVSEGCEELIINHQVWVATSNGEIIAGLFLVADDGFMKLANLAVHPNYKGKGLGGRLMKLAEDQSIEQGFSEMRLNTHLWMPENIQLYEHLGWEVISTRDNVVSMKKYL